MLVAYILIALSSLFFKTWIKELRCPFMVSSSAELCLSAGKHASKRRLKIIPLAHFKMPRLQEHNISYCVQTYDLNPFHLLLFLTSLVLRAKLENARVHSIKIWWSAWSHVCLISWLCYGSHSEKLTMFVFVRC